MEQQQNSETKVYLGDGVYIRNDGYHIVLTTENGISVQNEIFLEPIVVDRLLLMIRSYRELPTPE